MPGKVTKVVIPAAGLGTRFLPATKAMPKEMLPVVDKPAIQYVVEEAVNAGLTDVLMVTGRNKSALENHFDRHLELEASLTNKGDKKKLASIHEPSDLAQMHYVRQGEAKGLGHAIQVTETFVGDNPFAVILADDLIDEKHPILPTMIDVQKRYGGSVIAVMEVSEEEIHLYGCPSVAALREDGVFQVKDLVEKPDASEAPSRYAVIGRYILDPKVYDVLRKTKPGLGGEVQLTDALNTLAHTPEEEGGGVHAVVFSGDRYDTGDKMSYLQAVIRIACNREDLGPELRDWVKEFSKTL